MAIKRRIRGIEPTTESDRDPLMVDKCLEAHQVAKRPDTIRESGGNGRGSLLPARSTGAVAALAQTAMNPGQIEVGLIEVHLPFKPLDLFGEGHGLAGEAPVFVAQIQVLPFNRNRLNRVQGNIAEYCSFENPDQPLSLIPLLDHLTVAQGRTSHQFGPSRPPSLAGAGIGFNHMVAREKSAAVRIQAVTDPKRWSLLAQPFFGLGYQRFSQGGLRSADAEGNHHPRVRGQGNADPDLSLQSLALRRRSVFLTKLHRASNSTWVTFNCRISMALTSSLCSAATRSQWRTVSSFTSITSATPRKGIPLTNSLSAIRTLSSGLRRS